MNPYRPPAKDLVLAQELVPEVSTLRCRMFGHNLRGTYEKKLSSLGDGDRMRYNKGERFYEDGTFPNEHVSTSRFVIVWCKRCGREWRRQGVQDVTL